MNPTDAISAMCSAANMSRVDVSKAIGRHRLAVNGLIHKRASVRTDTMARIAAACGYQLQLVGNGETIVIDPPARD